MIIITLGKPKEVDPIVDDLGRSRIGYAEDMNERELFDAARWAWVLGEQANSERYALVVSDREVKQAIEILELVDVESEGSKRRAIEGKILRRGHPVYDAYVGGPSPVDPQRNPIKYHPTDFDLCRCGCGEPTLNYFVQGHDQKALHDRVAQIGNVAKFIDWFDKAYGSWPNLNVVFTLANGKTSPMRHRLDCRHMTPGKNAPRMATRDEMTLPVCQDCKAKAAGVAR